MSQPVFTHLWGRLDLGLGPSQKVTQGTRTAEAGVKQGGHGELEYGYAPPCNHVRYRYELTKTYSKIFKILLAHV